MTAFHDFSPSFALTSPGAESLLRSGSLHEVAREGGGGPCTPSFRALSRSGAEATKPTCNPPLCTTTTLCPAPHSLLACASTLPVGRSPESGMARGRHHPASCGAVAGRSSGGPQRDILPRAPGIHRGGAGHAVEPTSRAAPQAKRSAATMTESSAFGPRGSAGNLPAGEPNRRQPTIAVGFSGRVVLCPGGRRVLAWVPASALSLLGPILRRNGLVVREEA